jgi:hypothetical protein
MQVQGFNAQKWSSGSAKPMLGLDWAVKGVSFQFEEGRAIDSVEQFLDEIRRFVGTGEFGCYFRGEPSTSDSLQPSIGRVHHYLGKALTFTPEQERDLLHRFRRHAYEFFHRVPTDWESLFLARHYGLPTRLLDWTSNPLVALHFASWFERDTTEYADERGTALKVRVNVNGTVWAIQRRGNEDKDLDVFGRHSPLKVKGIKLVYPFYPTRRMTAQSGIFTLHGEPWANVVSCAGKRFPEKDLDIRRLRRWIVPHQHKAAIVVALERMAINSRTLFPDLDGLAKGLWQTEIIRSTCKKTSPGRPPKGRPEPETASSINARFDK